VFIISGRQIQRHLSSLQDFWSSRYVNLLCLSTSGYVPCLTTFWVTFVLIHHPRPTSLILACLGLTCVTLKLSAR
jgi:hypothetical protein